MVKGTGLTEAQVKFLSLLEWMQREFGGRHHFRQSAATRAVVARGLATMETFANPKIRTAVFSITPAGRAALAERGGAE